MKKMFKLSQIEEVVEEALISKMSKYSIFTFRGPLGVGKTTSAVSEKLKGTPGTTVEVTVRHFGADKDTTYNIVREKVKIPNVPYYGMVSNDIGYISLIQFSKNAGNDVKNAF
jgi:carboxyl-terminal processing protease